MTPLQIWKVLAVGGPHSPVVEDVGLRQNEPIVDVTSCVNARVESLTVAGALAVLVTLIGLRCARSGVLNDVDLIRAEKKAALWRCARARKRNGFLDGRQHVEQAGALFIGGRADVGRRAHEDLLDERRARVGPAMGRGSRPGSRQRPLRR